MSLRLKYGMSAFLNICKQQGIIPFIFHIYDYATQSCSFKPQLQNCKMIGGQGWDSVRMNQENYRNTSVNIFKHWISILIQESSKYVGGVLTTWPCFIYNTKFKSLHQVSSFVEVYILWTVCILSDVWFTVILSNFGLLGYISKIWPKGLTLGLLAANQSEEKYNAWL